MVDEAPRPQEAIEHAAEVSRGAALVKLADKVCNFHDLATSPSRDWSIERKQAYFDWARRVVERLPVSNAGLADAFAEAYRRRPS